MIDIATATVSQILSLKVPEKLFSAPEQVEIEFKLLAKRFHPDAGGDTKAFAHINMLHMEAKEKVSRKEWQEPGKLNFHSVDGKDYRIGFFKEFDIGFGKGYIGNKFVAYVIDKAANDLVESGLSIIKTFSDDKNYPNINAEAKTRIKQQLPKLVKSFKTDTKSVVVLEKPPEVIRLKDVVDHFGGKFNPKHAAWTTSRLLEICTYLQWAGLSHNDISMDSVFIDPPTHKIHLLGGWWHAVKIGERMKRLQTARTIANAPIKVLDTKIAAANTDLDMVRLTYREMLGDGTGTRILKEKTVPGPLLTWMRHASAGTALDDYKEWFKVLEKSFGARRFTELSLKPSDVYKENP